MNKLNELKKLAGDTGYEAFIYKNGKLVYNDTFSQKQRAIEFAISYASAYLNNKYTTKIVDRGTGQEIKSIYYVNVFKDYRRISVSGGLETYKKAKKYARSKLGVDGVYTEIVELRSGIKELVTRDSLEVY